MATTGRHAAIVRVVCAAVVSVCVCTGCERSSAESSSPADRDAPVPTLRLGYFANLTHAQAVLAVSSGELARGLAPATLETRIFNAGPSLTEALLAGEIDIGYVGPTPVLNAHAQTRGQGIRVLAGAAANGVVIVARPGSGIQRLEDLKDRRVATPQFANTQDVSARHYLMRVLGHPDASNVIPIANAEQAGLMQRGQIDAAWAPEPWGARLIAEVGATLVAEERDLWDGGRFTLTLVVTTPGFLARRAEAIRKVLRVHADWTRRLQERLDDHLPDLGNALFQLTGKALPPDVIHAACRRIEFTDEPLADSLETFARRALELGFLRDPPDLAVLVDTRLLRSLAP